MRVEEPGSCDPVKDFLGRGESTFMNTGIETEKIEDFEVRVCQADIRGIGDVSVVAKELGFGSQSTNTEPRNYSPLTPRQST